MMCTVDAWFSSCSKDAECVRPAPEKKWLGNRDENGLGAYEGPTSPIWCCDALKFYLRQICDIDMKSSLPTVILDMQSAARGHPPLEGSDNLRSQIGHGLVDTTTGSRLAALNG